MAEPVTQLDERFSDPAATATSWDESRQILETAELFWLTTVGRSGAPHVTPLVAVWLDDKLHFSTGVGEQKEVNLQGNPQVVLTTGRNDWDGGVDLVLEGEAVVVSDRATLTRLAEKWTTKWDGQWQYVVGDGCFHHPDGDGANPERILVFAVAPRKVFAFAKGLFGHTRHRF